MFLNTCYRSERSYSSSSSVRGDRKSRSERLLCGKVPGNPGGNSVMIEEGEK